MATAAVWKKYFSEHVWPPFTRRVKATYGVEFPPELTPTLAWLTLKGTFSEDPQLLQSICAQTCRLEDIKAMLPPHAREKVDESALPIFLPVAQFFDSYFSKKFTSLFNTAGSRSQPEN